MKTSPLKNRLLGSLFAAAFVLLTTGIEARTWTSADGTKTFEGELKAYDAATGNVTVTLASGKTLTFSQSRLSEADLTFLREEGGKVGGSDVGAKEVPDKLPDPDEKEADMSQPVQVFILMGQSNMLGFGAVNGGGNTLETAAKGGKYPFLVDDDGGWTRRKDVRNVRVMNFKDFTNDWMSPGNAGKIGPEIGIGYVMGEAMDAPVMILKSCIGNRSLGWDLSLPGSEQFEEGGKIYAGYKDSPDSWPKGTEPKRIGWFHAGKQYDDDTASAKQVLKDLDKYYPGAKEYEVAGFVFWQGDKDRYNGVHASRYEQNLVQLIKQLRVDFEAPNAKFVCATLGQTKKGAGGSEGKILEAQLAVDGASGKYPEFKGNVATVYAHPLSAGGASNSHYGGNANTYMDVGLGLGYAMAELFAK